MTLSGGVVRQLSDGLAELYAPASGPGGLDYAARVVSVVSRLIPVDSCSYNHIGGGPQLLAWLIEPADVGTFPGGIQLFQQHLPEHPVLAACMHAGEARAVSGRQGEAGILHAQRPEDVLRKIVAEPLPARPLHRLADPVDVDAVVPSLARIEHERQHQRGVLA